MKTLNEIFENIKIEGGIKKKIVASLLDKIEEAREQGYKITEIYEYLYKKGLDTSLENFRVILSELNKKGEKVENLKKVAVINFKGGVGKSTIANILDLPNKIVINLDTQDAENSNFSDTINYLSLKADNALSLDELLSILKEDGKEWVVFDTPGSITD
jgi:hypothetical protein